MWVSNLAVNDFRNYEQAVVEFPPGNIALIGKNAQGKTSLVEALAYLTNFTSHRASADTNLVRIGCAAAVVRARVIDGESDQRIEVEIIAGRANRAKINRAPVARVRDAAGICKTVVFSPEDLDVVRGDPQGRRRYLDDLGALLRPRLHAVKTEYERIMRQRGALLRNISVARRRGEKPDLATLEIWNEQFAHSAARLTAARIETLGAIEHEFTAAYEQVSGGHGASVIYRSKMLSDMGVYGPNSHNVEQNRKLLDEQTTAATYLEHIGQLRERELERGTNLAGPHLDDLDCFIRQIPVRGYASHGETWSTALALRLAAYRALSNPDYSWGSTPILILDDVFSELDEKRRQRLVSLISDAQQVFVTGAVGQELPASFTAQRYDVREGVVTRA